MKKVLLINGSPHGNGCTQAALDEMIAVFEKEGIETDVLQVGNQSIRGCVACGFCEKNGKCVFDDPVNEAAINLFYSTHFPKNRKVGCAVVSCRRGGNSASFDVLNKYFTITGMPVASSTYWNQVHGFTAEDVKKDLEGLQTMRNLAKNMAFMIRALGEAADKEGWPELETDTFTNFMDGK